MDEIIEAARAANAHDFIMRLPEQYETELGERGAQLSGGERQRIAVARAFLKDAPILILDEPTSSIDSKTEAVILDALDRLMVGRTTFMIAHRLSTIRQADLILVLDHGRLVEQGTHDELLRRGGLYKQLHDMQTRQVPAASRRGRLPPVAGTAAAEDAGMNILHAEEDRPARHDEQDPVAGVVWQTVQYLIGFQRLGYDATTSRPTPARRRCSWSTRTTTARPRRRPSSTA